MKKSKKGYKLEEEENLNFLKKTIRIFLPKSSFRNFESKMNFGIAFIQDVVGLTYNSIFLYGLYSIIF